MKIDGAVKQTGPRRSGAQTAFMVKVYSPVEQKLSDFIVCRSGSRMYALNILTISINRTAIMESRNIWRFSTRHSANFCGIKPLENIVYSLVSHFVTSVTTTIRLRQLHPTVYKPRIRPSLLIYRA